MNKFKQHFSLMDKHFYNEEIEKAKTEETRDKIRN
ncbi:Fur-regulated basic protein B [Cytobacillus oceanisediminis]